MKDPISPDIMRAYQAVRPTEARDRLCHGPWQGMFFTFGGIARVCCLNGHFSLGTYPEDSIADMWQGPKRRELKKAIRANSLSRACFVCKEHMLARSFDAIHSRMFDHLTDSPPGYPSVMTFELSNACPFRCIMCSGMFSSAIRKKHEKRPPQKDPYDAAFVEQLEDFIPHLVEMKFFGGEPFFNPLYPLIWEKALKKNPDVTMLIQTGTCLLSHKTKKILEKGRFNINISLDSLKKETYEKIRLGGKFSRFMKNQEYLLDYARANKTFLGMSVCPMRQNWPELADIVNHCNQHGVSVYFNTVFKPAHCALWNLSSEKLTEIQEVLSSFDLPDKTEIQAKNRTHYQDFLKLVSRWAEEARAREKALASTLPGTWERLGEIIRVKLEFDGAQNAAIRTTAIMDKISEALSGLPPGVSRAQVFSGLEETHPGLLIRGYENNTAEETRQIIAEDMARLARKTL